MNRPVESHAELLFDLVDDATARLRGGEVMLASLSAEESDFVRFNQARVRQAMTVRQVYLTLHLIAGKRRDTTILALRGGLDEDRGRVRRAPSRPSNGIRPEYARGSPRRAKSSPTSPSHRGKSESDRCGPISPPKRSPRS